MAWLNNKSHLNWGNKIRNKPVEEINDTNLLIQIHESKYNVYFTDEVFDRIQKYPGRGAGRKTKYFSRDK